MVKTFGGYEAPIRVDFVMDKRGSLTIRVTIVDDLLTMAELWFIIEADQSYLAGWISDIEGILHKLGA